MNNNARERRETPHVRPSLVALVGQAPRPRLADKGKLLGIDQLQAILPPYQGKPRSRWWFNHSFLPEKRIKIGRDAAWWEVDVVAYLDGAR